MFQTKRTIINGVELPADFPIASVINNVAISGDGRYAAVTRTGDLIVGDIPPSGKIEVDGTVINYQKGTGRSGITIGSGKYNIRGASAVMVSGGSYVSIDGGSDLEYEIDQSYNGVSHVSLSELANDIRMGASGDCDVHVKGLTSSKPEYDGGRLRIDRLQGTLLLPFDRKDLEQDLRTVSGDIKGDVAHRGRLKTVSGDISLHLTAPLIVEVGTISGDIDVRGMMADGRGRYRPAGDVSVGTLGLETVSGDVSIWYVGK